MFETIGIVTKPNDPNSKKVALQLVPFLKNLGAEALFYQQEIAERAKMIIVLGGDGTFVGAARTFIDTGIPILGVNLGTLGFLTDIDAASMFESIEDVLLGKFNQEERFMLECTLGDKTVVALNDVVLHRGNTPKMVKTDIYLNDKFVNNGSADGLIVATPTGSTAYALSSGGPLINIGVEAVSLTYISPHAMTYRPFIFEATDEVRVKLLDPKQGANVVLDGQITLPIESNEEIFIRKYEKNLNLIHPYDYNFFEILRNKLHWNK